MALTGESDRSLGVGEGQAEAFAWCCSSGEPIAPSTAGTAGHAASKQAAAAAGHPDPINTSVTFPSLPSAAWVQAGGSSHT